MSNSDASGGKRTNIVCDFDYLSSSDDTCELIAKANEPNQQRKTNDEPQITNSQPSEDNQQRGTDDDTDACPVAKGVPECRRCLYPGCTKFRRENRMCMHHNTNSAKRATGESAMPRSRKRQVESVDKDDEAQSVPKYRMCIHSGCTKFRRENRMCIYHNTMQDALKRNEDGELLLFL